MLVSAFELLFEPITPKAQPPINPSPDVPDPTVVQAYFALISNVGEKPVTLKLTFTSTLSLKNTFTVFDTTNTFPIGSAKPLTFAGSQFNKGTVELPFLQPGETGLFLLQPDIAALIATLGKSPNISKANFAARGYVDVEAVGDAGTECLISPQIRGTFLNQASIVPLNLNVVAQEAYSLPTQNNNVFKFD